MKSINLNLYKIGTFYWINLKIIINFVVYCYMRQLKYIWRFTTFKRPIHTLFVWTFLSIENKTSYTCSMLKSMSRYYLLTTTEKIIVPRSGNDEWENEYPNTINPRNINKNTFILVDCLKNHSQNNLAAFFRYGLFGIFEFSKTHICISSLYFFEYVIITLYQKKKK